MKEKKDTLLQQIVENSRESIVFFATAVVEEQSFMVYF